MKKNNYAINVFIFKLNKPDWVYKKKIKKEKRFFTGRVANVTEHVDQDYEIN